MDIELACSSNDQRNPVNDPHNECHITVNNDTIQHLAEEEITYGQESNTKSIPITATSNDKTRRHEKKLHRCLHDLKQFLITSNRNAYSESDHSESTSPPQRLPRITSANAVRRALKLLKRHGETERIRNEEMLENRPAPIVTSLFNDATDIRVYSECVAASCWSPESGTATRNKTSSYDDIIQDHQNTIRFVISCNDMTILKVSENAYNVLQLVPSSWPLPGRQFLDLCNANDHPILVAFMLNTNLILKTIHLSSISENTQNDDHQENAFKHSFAFYSSLRRGSLSSTWNEEPKYIHCRLTCKLLWNQQRRENADEAPPVLSISALPISILLGPEYPEISNGHKFYTKHNSSCIFTYVDAECVKAWGYLPQELVGRSLLSFISKDSLKCLEAVHERAIKSKGKPVRSKLYYFVLRDGKLATMQSEWSLFVNPWTRETEFVIGCHKVIDRSKDARFFHDDCSNATSIRLDSRAAKAQVRIRRILEKVKDQLYYKFQTRSKVTICSSSIDKENGSHNSSGSTGTIQNGSTSAGQTYNSLSSTTSYTKTKRALNMGVFLDRMIESELFRHVDTRNDNDAALDTTKMVIIDDTNGHLETNHENRIIHHETSPISTGEAISSSPPDSNGSGPTYKEINLKEKVARFLNSQTSGQTTSSHPDSAEGCKSQHSDEYSPPTYHQLEPAHENDRERGVATGAESIATVLHQDPSLNAVNLSTVVAAASVMHRSSSAAADLNQYRHLTAALESDVWNVPLTPEILRQFTKEKERESKADWKRRFSTVDMTGIPVQAQQQESINCVSNDQSINQKISSADRISPQGKRPSVDQQTSTIGAMEPPQKILRSAADQFYLRTENRPSSMPVISRILNSGPDSGNKTAPGVPMWPSHIVSRNTTDYYRSLGPTPAPPPGKNFQISSAPLPVPAPNPVVDPFSVNLEKGPFPYGASQQTPLGYAHQSAFAPPPPKPGLGQPNGDGHRSVIQASTSSSLIQPPTPTVTPTGTHWLQMPGNSASAILQRMVPKALAREQAEAAATGFWCPSTQNPSSDTPILDIYTHGYQTSTQQPINHNSQAFFDCLPPQQGPHPMTNNFLGTYGDFSNTLENRIHQKAGDAV